jgi:uncharacterized protein involved in exopolysaccharide biosynthesis
MSDRVVDRYESPFAGLDIGLRRNRRAMLIAFLGTAAAFGAAALVMPASYKATSMLMVRIGQEYLVNGDPASTSMYVEREQLFASEAAMLETPQLAMQVIDQVGLRRLYPSLAETIDPADPTSSRAAMERAALRFERHLHVLPIKDSTLYRIDFTHGDPQVAADTVNWTIKDYLKNRRQNFEYGYTGALDGQVAQTLATLQAKVGAVQAIKERGGITDIARQLSLLFDQKADLTRIKDQADIDAAGETAQIAVLEPIAAAMRPTVLQVTASPGPGQLAVRDALAKLRLRRDEMRISFKTDTPQIEDIDHQIAMAESLMRDYHLDQAAQTVTARPGSFTTLTTALAEARAQRAASVERSRVAAAGIATVDGATLQLSVRQVPLDQGMRELQAAQDAYYQALKRVSEARAHDNMMERAKPNVEVIQEARPPYQETWLRAIVAAAGIVLGSMLAGTILYMDSVSRSWRTQ